MEILPSIDIKYLHGVGSQLIWPKKWRPVESPPPCGENRAMLSTLQYPVENVGEGWVIPAATTNAALKAVDLPISLANFPHSPVVQS